MENYNKTQYDAGLDAKEAFWLIFIWFFTQILLGIFLGLWLGFQSNFDQIATMKELEKTSLINMMVYFVSGIVFVVMVLNKARNKPIIYRQVGLVPVYTTNLISALIIGIAIAQLSNFICLTFFPHGETHTPEPVKEMIVNAVEHRYLLIIFVVLIAPLTEEFIFRGTLFAAFAKSWGAKYAAIITSIIFIGLHYQEILAYMPGAIGLIALTFIAMLMRIRTNSIQPAIAVHIGYNFMIISNLF